MSVATVAPAAAGRRRRSTLRRFLGEPVAFASFAFLAAVVLAALLAPWLGLPDPVRGSLVDRLKPPLTPGHPLGTDEFGRDMLSRVVWGARVSLGVGFGAVGLAVAVGVTLGLLSGYLAGAFDFWVQRLVDQLMAFPYVLLALLVVAILGPGLTNTMLAIAIAGVPYYVRIARGSALSLREREFVEAGRAMGAGTRRMMFRHMLPNAVAPLVVAATLGVASAILTESALSFLGLGVQPPLPSWGNMLTDALTWRVLALKPWLWIPPGIMIFAAVMAINLVGDGLRDALDPRLKN